MWRLERGAGAAPPPFTPVKEKRQRERERESADPNSRTSARSRAGRVRALSLVCAEEESAERKRDKGWFRVEDVWTYLRSEARQENTGRWSMSSVESGSSDIINTHAEGSLSFLGPKAGRDKSYPPILS